MVSLPSPPLMTLEPGNAGDPAKRLGTTEAKTLRLAPLVSANVPASARLPRAPKPDGAISSCGVFGVRAEGRRLTEGITIWPPEGSAICASPGEAAITTALTIQGISEAIGEVFDAALPKMMSLPPLAVIVLLPPCPMMTSLPLPTVMVSLPSAMRLSKRAFVSHAPDVGEITRDPSAL